MLEMNFFILLFFLFKFTNLRIVYVFSENSIFNQIENKRIKGTKLDIFESG